MSAHLVRSRARTTPSQPPVTATGRLSPVDYEMMADSLKAAAEIGVHTQGEGRHKPQPTEVSFEGICRENGSPSAGSATDLAPIVRPMPAYPGGLQSPRWVRMVRPAACSGVSCGLLPGTGIAAPGPESRYSPNLASCQG